MEREEIALQVAILLLKETPVKRLTFPNRIKRFLGLNHKATHEFLFRKSIEISFEFADEFIKNSNEK